MTLHTTKQRLAKELPRVRNCTAYNCTAGWTSEWDKDLTDVERDNLDKMVKLARQVCCDTKDYEDKVMEFKR